MRLYQTIANRFVTSKMTRPEQTLRSGQIVQGEIVKLYPNNRAEIKLATQSMIAQLEVSLAIGEKYHFQVQTADDVIHLKVLGEQLSNNQQNNITTLMQQLGYKATKLNTTFIKQLITEKIPFDTAQLEKALFMLERALNKGEAIHVLKGMIATKMPLTDGVFQAVLQKNTNSLTGQMHALLQLLKQEPNGRSIEHLIERLSDMLERPGDVRSLIHSRIMNEATTGSKPLFQTLRGLELINSQINFNQMIGEQQQNNNMSENISSTGKTQKENEATLIRLLEQMVTNKSSIQAVARESLQLFSLSMKQAVVNNSQLKNQDFQQLQQQINHKLLPLISDNQQQQTITLLRNTPDHLQQILQVLQVLLQDDLYVHLEKLVREVNQNHSFLLANPSTQFLQQAKQMLLFAGLAYEHQIANDTMQQQTTTIKAMLLQIIQQQNDGEVKEQSQRLLHLLNGIQLQSVQETSNFIQASLQFPGEKLGLHQDIELEFEGRKNEQGKINADYCRIYFYLHLANLKETVIDMNIQKRAVAITIYNDYAMLKQSALSFQPMLKKGLESLNYQLSSITYKPFLQRVNMHANKLYPSYQSTTFEGVDYRI